MEQQKTSSRSRRFGNTASRETLVSLGAVMAALGATTCCLGTLVLLSLGFTGAWLANLSAFEPYTIYMAGAAAAFLCVRYMMARRKRQCNGADPTERHTFSARLDRAAVWSTVVLIMAAVSGCPTRPLAAEPALTPKPSRLAGPLAGLCNHNQT